MVGDATVEYSLTFYKNHANNLDTRPCRAGRWLTREARRLGLGEVGSTATLKSIGGFMDGLAVSVDGLATRIEVRRLPDVVSSRTFLPAGLEIVNMLTDYLKVNRSLLVDRLASLQLIQLLGTVDPMTNGRVTTIKGRSLTSGFPSSMEITSEEVQRAISDALDHWVLVIAGSVKFYIQEQENTAASNQITLRGEFRHINDFSQRLESATGVRVVVEE